MIADNFNLVIEFITSSTLFFMIALYCLSGCIRDKTGTRLGFKNKVILVSLVGFIALYILRSQVCKRENYMTLFKMGSAYSQQDFRKGYRESSIELHPDKNVDTEDKYATLTNVYNLLRKSKDPRLIWGLHVQYGGEIDIFNQKMIEAEVDSGMLMLQSIVGGGLNIIMVMLLSYMFFLYVPRVSSLNRIVWICTLLLYVIFELLIILQIDITDDENNSVPYYVSDLFRELFSVPTATGEDLRYLIQGMMNTTFVQIYLWTVLTEADSKEDLFNSFHDLLGEYKRTLDWFLGHLNEELRLKLNNPSEELSNEEIAEELSKAGLNQENLELKRLIIRTKFKKYRKNVRAINSELQSTNISVIQRLIGYTHYIVIGGLLITKLNNYVDLWGYFVY